MKSYVNFFTKGPKKHEFIIVEVRSDCKEVYLDWMSALCGRVPCDFLVK